MPYINKKPKKERVKHSKRSNNSQIFYNDIRWKRLRNWYIKQTPLCEECLKNGISTPAEHIHHKIPFMSGKDTEDKWRLLLDPLNLEALCIDCHHKIHEELRVKDNKQDKQSLYHVVDK